MMNFINTIVTNFWSCIDEPLTRRLAEGVIDSINLWLNGLTARGALLGGCCVFLESENPKTSLSAGMVKFHTGFYPILVWNPLNASDYKRNRSVPHLYTFLLPLSPLKKLKAKSPSQDILKRALSTV